MKHQLTMQQSLVKQLSYIFLESGLNVSQISVSVYERFAESMKYGASTRMDLLGSEKFSLV